MYLNPPLTKRFLKNLFDNLSAPQVKFKVSGCDTINLYFQDESRFGLLTILRRMITARSVKPVAPFLHRFDNLYLFGAFSPITGDKCLLELPYCNSQGFQIFLDHLSQQNSNEFKVVILDNGAFHHANRLNIPYNISLVFLPPYSPELNPAEKMWRYIKDRMSMIAYNNIEDLQQRLTQVVNNITTIITKSICGNEFYLKTFKYKFNV